MPIPISKLVQVLPSTIVPAGNAVDMLGLFITDSPKIPTGVVKSYSSIADVGEDFNSDEKEYIAANSYFLSFVGATQRPKSILFSRFINTDPTPAVLTGGNLGQMTVDQLKAITGDLTVKVSGKDLSGKTISFADITTFADAATAIQTALDNDKKTITVSYNPTGTNFVITTVATGNTATIAAATGSLAAQIKLDSASAKTAQGVTPLKPVDFMNNLIKLNRNWGTFTTLYNSSVEDKLAFSSWTNSQDKVFGYVDREAVDVLSDDWSKTWWGQVKAQKMEGTFPLYEEGDNPVYPAFVMGYAASLDFNRTNGRTTPAFRTQSGLPAVDIDGGTYDRLTEFGYNVYANFSAKKEDFNFLQQGKVSGQFVWFDTFINQIYLNANLQLRTVRALMNNPSIPYNQKGYDIFITTWAAQCDAFVNFGGIQAGVTLDPAQIQQVNGNVGADVSDALYNKGYYIDIKDAPSSVRIERGSPPASLYYVDGGSIQQITLASVAIL